MEIYRYKGVYYKLLSVVSHKNPDTREWDAVVLYQNAEGQLFTRWAGEFYERFAEVHAVEFDNAHSLLHLAELKSMLDKDALNTYYAHGTTETD